MKQALHRLHDDRTFAVDNIEDALHAQQVIAMAEHQRVEPVGDMVPMQWLVEPQHERSDLGAVAVDVVMVSMSMVMIVGTMRTAMCLGVQPFRDIGDFGGGIVDVDSGKLG